MAIEKENFGQQFGSAFQTKVIAGLLIDQSFVDKIWAILKPEYFDSKIHNWLFKNIVKHYEAYRTMPTVEDLDMYMREEKNETQRLEAFELLKSVQKSDPAGLRLAKDRALDFCKNHNMRNALLHSVTLWEQGKYEEIKKEVERALFAGEDDGIGHDYFDDAAINRRYADSNRQPVPTGMKHLDMLLNGGLSRGEMGVIIAGTGVGKTWLLCYIGYSALKAKKKVIHYTFELHEDYVGIRYDTMFSGIPIDQLSGKVPELKLILNQYTDNSLIIKEYNPKTVTINDLRNHIESRLLRRSFVPDLLVVDYADLIRPHSKYTDKRFELESIYEELRGLAKEFSLPVWTASQGNRLAMMQNVVQMETIAEGWSKAGVADVVVTLARRLEDKLVNEGRLFLAKNRAGSDGQIIPINMDTKNFKIETLEPITDSDEIESYTKQSQESYNDKIRQQKEGGKDWARTALKKAKEKREKRENGNQTGTE